MRLLLHSFKPNIQSRLIPMIGHLNCLDYIEQKHFLVTCCLDVISLDFLKAVLCQKFDVRASVLKSAC